MTGRHEQTDPALGAGVGGRLAQLVSAATVLTREKLGPHQVNVASKIFTDVTNHVSDEIRGVMGPLWTQLARDPATPAELRPLMRSLATQRGQAWAWIGGTATGAALGAGIIDWLNNAFAPVTTRLIAAEPNLPVSIPDAVGAEVKGLRFANGNAREAAFNGLERERFDVLVEAARPWPTIAELWSLLNRGDITGADMAEALHRMGFRDHWIADLMNLRHIDDTAEVLAAEWNRGIIDEDRAVELGRRVGTSPEQMRRLLELGGEPPGPQELLLAWRRGVVTEAQVDRALRQSPLRFEWIPTIKSLQWVPLPTGEAADAVNQQHMTLAQGQAAARLNGILPDDFEIFVKNAGIPPGPQTVLDWVNRGLITEDEALQALYESRIKNVWVPTYLESRHETMPPETVRLMYTRGALSTEDALRRLQMRGYSPEDAAIILDGASAEKTQGARDLTTSQILEMYSDRMITRDDALMWLTALGFDEAEGLWQIDLADMRRLRRFVTAATNRIRSSYVAGHIDEGTANVLMDTLGVNADFKDDALRLWDIERATTSKGLTVAQVTAAVKKSIITPAEAMGRLTGQGYDQNDAAIILALAGVGAE